MTQKASHERADGALAARPLGWHREPVTIGIPMIRRLIGVVIATALTAFLVSLTQTRMYGAQTDIVFDPGPDLSDAAADRALITQEAVLRSAAVLGPPSTAMNIPIKELDKSLAVEFIGRSNVMRFTVVDPEPNRAQVLAQMITDEYNKKIMAMKSERIQRSTEYLQTKIDQLSTTLRDVRANLEARTRQRLRGQLASLDEQQLEALSLTTQQQISSLQNQLTAVELQRFAQPQGQVLTPPHVLDDPVQPRPVRALALGALVGIFIAAGAVGVLMWPRLVRNAMPWTNEL